MTLFENNNIKPMNLTFWKELKEEAGAAGGAGGAASAGVSAGSMASGMAALGGTPTPALAQLSRSGISAATVNGIPVPSQSTRKKKSKKKKKNESVQSATIVSPDDLIDLVEETFRPDEILQTTVENNRERINVSVFYSNPEDRAMVHTIELEFLDPISLDILDTVILEDLTIQDCVEELQSLFRTHVQVNEDVEQNSTMAMEVRSLLTKAQAEENDAITSYLEKAKRCKELGIDKLVDLFNELAKDETVHTGCLQAALDEFDLSELDDVLDGQEEAQEIFDKTENTNIVNTEIENVIEQLLQEDFHEAYEEITNLLAKQLDRMNFEFANTEDIIYKKEGKYKYLLKFDNKNGFLKFKISKDDNVIEVREWKLDEGQDISPIFKEIEDLYNKYGI